MPKRHVGSFFDLSADQRADLLGLLDAAKADIDREFKPVAYSIGINDGHAAGQADSMGKFFYAQIKGQFDCRVLRVPAYKS